MKNTNHYINSVLKLLESNNLDKAKLLLDIIIKQQPENPLILFLFSQFYLKKKKYKKSIQFLEKVNIAAPNKPNTKIALANLYLKINNYSKCYSILCETEELAKNIVAFFQLKGNYYKAIGDIDNSIINYEKALKLLRHSRFWNNKYNDKAIIDPIQNNTFRYASKSKLEHDLNQIDYLIKTVNLPIQKEQKNLKEVINSWSKSVDDDKLIYLDEKNYNLIKNFYNRVLYISQHTKTNHSPLNKKTNFKNIETKYFESDQPIVVIDNFLCDETLQSLWKYCLESTIWFDSKENGGYLGTYMTDAFHHPALFEIAKNLHQKMPKIFDKKKLCQMWALKYKPGGKGTRLHADDALVNLNFWITPDEAKQNLNNNSGIVIYDKPVPDDWRFEEYNQSDLNIKEHLRKTNPKKIEIPYKQNRAVIFDSKFIHKSQNINFKEGYTNQRINITMLFDKQISNF